MKNEKKRKKWEFKETRILEEKKTYEKGKKKDWKE